MCSLVTQSKRRIQQAQSANRPVDVGKVREAGRGGVKATVPFSLLFLPPPIPHLSDQVFLGYCLTAIDAAGATLGGFQAGPSGALR